MFATNIINYFFFFDKAGCTRCFFRKTTSTSLNLKFFLKSTRPSLPLKKAPPLISVFFNSLYDPFGSPCRGQKPQGRRGNRPTRCSNRCAIRLADHQRSTPAAELRFLCGMNTLSLKDLLKGCLLVAEFPACLVLFFENPPVLPYT